MLGSAARYLALLPLAIEWAHCTQVQTFSDSECEVSLNDWEGPNGYPGGLCTSALRQGNYSSFMITALDPGCASKSSFCFLWPYKAYYTRSCPITLFYCRIHSQLSNKAQYSNTLWPRNTRWTMFPECCTRRHCRRPSQVLQHHMGLLLHRRLL